MIFGTFCAVMTVHVFFFYPETADRSLEDIERSFRENHDVFVFRHKDMTSVNRPRAYIVDEESRIQESKTIKGGSLYPEVQQVEVA